MLSAGLTVGQEKGIYSSLRARYFAPRPLEESGQVESKAGFQVNARLGYKWKNWDLAVDCLNLLDREDNDIEYYYASRLPGEPAAGVADIHLHPVEPRQFRVSATYRW
jgi:outer membrane receptor protein involved in Fe transport